ncbi:hypothetical protein EGW08_004267, partial [Elysia chlorotica]
SWVKRSSVQGAKSRDLQPNDHPLSSLTSPGSTESPATGLGLQTDSVSRVSSVSGVSSSVSSGVSSVFTFTLTLTYYLYYYLCINIDPGTIVVSGVGRLKTNPLT